MTRKDLNQTAFSVVQQATGEQAAPPAPTERQLNSRKGGLSGGKARASALSSEERSNIAKLAAEARWRNKKQ